MTPILIYKFGHCIHNLGFKKTAKLIAFINRLIFSTWLPSSAVIGKNFTVGYWGLGIVIHSDTKIGDNVTIAQNVTIGRDFKDEKVPEILNDVYIGAGSVVFGEIVIGNNVIIGSNSLVNKNIPDNCTVVGNPCHIIKIHRMEKYYELNIKNEKPQG
jgi:serine O-acetyltransferase